MSATCDRSMVFLCSPVSSTNKTDRHDITEILLKVVLNTIKQTNKPIARSMWYYIICSCEAQLSKCVCQNDLTRVVSLLSVICFFYIYCSDVLYIFCFLISNFIIVQKFIVSTFDYACFFVYF